MTLATTTVTVLRGTGTDGYGDEVDLDTTVYTRVPASILEASSNRRRPVEGRTDNAKTYVCRIFNRSVELRRDDRLRDERTGATYTIDDIPTPTSNVGLNSVRANLRRVT
jgi:hypothetical protein